MLTFKDEKDNINLNEIRSFLDDNEVEYSTERDNFCLYHDHPNGKRSYEIEYIPSTMYPISYSKYNIEGVEKDFFLKQSIEAENNNSFKLWIKGFEWENDRQREVLKSYILHAAHKTPYNWYARDCEIREVNSKEGRLFESENCFYGKRGASLTLGLYSKKDRNRVPAGTLLMLYSFGKNFFAKKEGIIEVIRVGTRKFSYVAGGSSKLFKHFLNNYKTITISNKTMEVNQVKYYVDADHNLGGSLESVGFQFDSSTPGFLNYWIEEGVAKQRQPMKHKWVMEQMSLGKVLAIPNCGVKTFIYNL